MSHFTNVAWWLSGNSQLPCNEFETKVKCCYLKKSQSGPIVIRNVVGPASR